MRAAASHQLSHALTLLCVSVAGCAHTVGALEVASRATVEFDCDTSQTFVQTLARNHYQAVGCGKRAVFICRSGACERDSDVLDTPADAVAAADGQNAHERLNGIRERVLECLEGSPDRLELDATFGADGMLSDSDFDLRNKDKRMCIRGALRDLGRVRSGYEHPIYVRHVFSSEPWSSGPLPERPPATPAVSQPESQPDSPMPAEQPVDTPVANTDAADVAVAEE
jgi:hypothetical protein